MQQNNRIVGNVKEEQAIIYLKSLGYKILDKNFHCRHGEIDIIAIDNKDIVFIEVKFRKNKTSGAPEEAVNANKQIKISKCASYFLYTHQSYYEYQVRFDVVGILSDSINHIKNAFDFALPGYY